MQKEVFRAVVCLPTVLDRRSQPAMRSFLHVFTTALLLAFEVGAAPHGEIPYAVCV